MTGNLAERKRQLVRDELSSAALKLLAYQGFDETTIDQIVSAAGVSRRTFFRYFKSKDDVIIEYLGDLGEQMRMEIAARPPTEKTVTTIRHGLSVFVDTFAAFPEKALPLARLTFCTPALRARYLERQQQWQEAMASELARRSDVDLTKDIRPRLFAAVAFGAFDVALARWVETDAADSLPTLVEEAIDLVAGVLRL